MTTLAANKPRAYEGGNRNDLPMVASDIIYEGAAVGVNPSTGYARPLVEGDSFAGFAEATADNSAGAAGAVNVRVIYEGLIQIPVTSVAITDFRKAVYATDDDTFALSGASDSSPIGTVHRFVSTGIAVVDFKAQL